MNTLISDIPNKAYKHGKTKPIPMKNQRWDPRVNKTLQSKVKGTLSNPNPFIKPLWEASEINQKNKQLEAITKTNK